MVFPVVMYGCENWTVKKAEHQRIDFFFPFIFISWRLITLQYCSGFCHTLTWISHGFSCISHPDPPSHLPLYPIPHFWTLWEKQGWDVSRIDVFELWYWRRLLRVPWAARRSKQSILKEISPGCSLEGLMLKLKLQYFGHLMQRADSLGKSLMLGGTGGRRKRGWQRMR